MNKKIIITIGIMTAVLIIGATSYLQKRGVIAEISDYIKHKAIVPQEESNTSAVTKTFEELKIQEQAIRAKYTQLIEKEKEEGCYEVYEEGTAKGDFCGESYDKVNEWTAQEKEEINNLYARPESERIKTIAKIQEAIDDLDADIIFDHIKPDERYPDTKMNEVYYDKTNYAWIFVDNKTGEILKIQEHVKVLDLLD